MLDATQRARIKKQLLDNLNLLSIPTLWLPERAVIKNESDFPLCQVTFISEGNRLSYWSDILFEEEDPDTHFWSTHYGHIARATVSIALESLDVEELHIITDEYYHMLWNNHINTLNWGEHKLEFRSVEPPKFLPPYKDSTGRHDIYQCRIDAYIDYEFSWPVITPPITVISHDISIGTDDDNILIRDGEPMILCAPTAYLMDLILAGDTPCRHYKMNGAIAGEPALRNYKMTAIVAPIGD